MSDEIYVGYHRDIGKKMDDFDVYIYNIERERQLFLSVKNRILEYNQNKENTITEKEKDYLIKVIDYYNKEPEKFSFGDEYNFFVSAGNNFITTKIIYLDFEEDPYLFICTLQKNYIFKVI